MRLGIFDSGIGGEAVAIALRVTFPQADIITVNDQAHVPYGDKTQKEVIHLTDTAIQPLLTASCDVIILACNTATMAALETLRARYPRQKFIGIEPMIKTAAALTKSGVIAVCATPATLASTRYHELKKLHAKDLTVLEPDCSEWASMIQNSQINHERIEGSINSTCKNGADIIVLGCTHYHWIKDFIVEITRGRAHVIEPSAAIGRRVKQLLKLR